MRSNRYRRVRRVRDVAPRMRCACRSAMARLACRAGMRPRCRTGVPGSVLPPATPSPVSSPAVDPAPPARLFRCNAASRGDRFRAIRTLPTRSPRAAPPRPKLRGSGASEVGAPRNRPTGGTPCPGRSAVVECRHRTFSNCRALAARRIPRTGCSASPTPASPGIELACARRAVDGARSGGWGLTGRACLLPFIRMNG